MADAVERLRSVRLERGLVHCVGGREKAPCIAAHLPGRLLDRPGRIDEVRLAGGDGRAAESGALLDDRIAAIRQVALHVANFIAHDDEHVAGAPELGDPGDGGGERAAVLLLPRRGSGFPQQDLRARVGVTSLLKECGVAGQPVAECGAAGIV